MISIQNYVNGELLDPHAEVWMDDFEPATGAVYARVPNSSGEDVERAVAAAAAASKSWGSTPASERGRWLREIATRIETRLEELARAESIDNGKPISLARAMDIPRACANLRFFASAAEQFFSESHSMEGGINYTLRQPLGVVGCISPWNLPLYLFTWKIAPALAAGNCVVAKPSELTPMTAFIFSQICRDVGLPSGVLNILHGEGPRVGQSMVEHPGIHGISFTGGTLTGSRIAETAGPKFKKLSLELGGKNPTLVFADCDWEPTLDGVARSGFANQGEVCLCGSRIFVERTIYERFRDELVQRVASLRQGDPLEAETQQGAVVSEAHMNKILGYIELAKEEGGRILCGGKRHRPAGRCESGWFIEPTLIEGLDATCRTNQEEIFGPVATLIPFDSEEEAIELANGVDYGLAASVWSSNVSTCHRVAARLQSGIVWVNCWLVRDLRTPFGGVKSSGVGREGGFEALRFFTEAKNVCVQFH